MENSKINKIKFFKYLQEKNSDFISEIEKVYEIMENELKLISKTFDNYTDHGIDHSIKVANYMFEMVSNVELLSDLEIAICVYSALLHDLGMIVTDEIKEKIIHNVYLGTEFKYENVLLHFGDEKTAIQEIIRPIHGARVDEVFKNKDYNYFYLKEPNIDYSQHVFNICKSHGENSDWIEKELKTNLNYGEYKLNCQYIAFLLRIADLLDIDSTRTPMYLYKLINPTGVSDTEWQQHFIVTNSNKIISNDNRNKTFYFEGTCKYPIIHRKILSYIDYLEKEVQCIIAKSYTMNEKYHINFEQKIDNQIKGESYTFANAKLQLDYQAITGLLMGEKIYGNKECGLREIIQNSMDACLLMNQIPAIDTYEKYHPEIKIILDEDKDLIVIRDNGIGMTKNILFNYFLSIGKSYYRSNEYKFKGYAYQPIGNYGIGFLACFMLSQNVSVETKHYSSAESIVLELEKGSEYVCIKEKTTQSIHGTDIILALSEVKSAFNVDKAIDLQNKIKGYLETNFLNTIVEISIQNIKTQEKLRLDWKTIPDSIDISSYLVDIECNIKYKLNEMYSFPQKLEDFFDDCYYIEDNKIKKAGDANFVKNFTTGGVITYVEIFVVTSEDEDDFKKFYEVLDDYDETISRLNNIYSKTIICNYSDYFANIGKRERGDCLFCSDNDEYTYDNFCDQFCHSDQVPIKINICTENVIKLDNAKKALLFKEKYSAMKNEGWFQSKLEKIYNKNVLIKNATIIFPFFLKGLTLTDMVINIKNNNVVPNVARDNLSNEDATKLSYAIGKAIHQYLYDNILKDPSEKELLKELINTKYNEKNEFYK